MGDAFLAQAAAGRGRRWHYILGLALVVAGWVLAAVVLYLAFELASPAFALAEERLGSWASDYIRINVAFLPLIPVLAVVMALWHGRPLRSLATAASRVAWGRMALAFAAALVLFAALSLLAGDDEPGGTVRALLLALPLIVLLTPIQAAGEELLFRGYVLQASAAFVCNKAAIVIFNGALFAALHAFNPAAQASPLLAPIGYFLSGAGLALVALRDDGLELPIGGHIANNLVSFMVLAYLQQPLEREGQDYDPLLHYVASLAPILLLLALAQARPRRPASR